MVGAEFEVSFEGSLRRVRGGYFWIQEVDGAPVALLRSDGNPEIPMSYDIDVANAGMLDDGLSGESSTLVSHHRSSQGCITCAPRNSPEDVCIEVDVRATSRGQSGVLAAGGSRKPRRVRVPNPE